MADNDGSEPVPVMQHQNSAKENWKGVGGGVMQQVQVSRAFTTLRDMISDCFIDPSTLQAISVLGEGAYAKVEKAWYCPASGGARYMVAVKRLKKELFRNKDDLKLFVDEVALMKKLRHRNIIEFVGAGELAEASECAYVVQEYMAGGNLKQLVSKQMINVHGKPLYNHSGGLDICLQMARGLRYLHSAQPMVIHRDLKLENVLLKSDKPVDGCWEVKLADFGLSRRVDVKQSAIAEKKMGRALSIAADPAQSSELEEMWTRKAGDSFLAAKNLSATKKGGASHPGLNNTFDLTGRTGSLMYMAPEVFLQQPYSEKADVFSFGVMMYEVMHKYIMLSAVSVAGTYEELEDYATRVAAGYRPPVLKTWPESLSRLIESCWAQEPAVRPSMEQVVMQLEQMKEEGLLDQLDQKQQSGCSCVIC